MKKQTFNELMKLSPFNQRLLIQLILMMVLNFSFETKAEEQFLNVTAAPQAEQEIKSAPTTNKAEAEIPLKLDQQKKKDGSETPIARFILIIGFMGVLLAGSFFLIRKSKLSGIKRKNAPELKVLTQHYLGPKKSLAIIRVAGESIVIGITDHHISHIKTLSLLDEDIPTDSPNEFAPVLNQENQKLNTQSNKKLSDDTIEDKIFSMQGIQSLVSEKLKNMRSLE